MLLMMMLMLLLLLQVQMNAILILVTDCNSVFFLGPVYFQFRFLQW